MSRFSRDKRFFSKVSFEEFVETAGRLMLLIRIAKPSARIEVLTCEERETYLYSQVTFMGDEVTAALKKRKRYALEQCTNEVWKKSFKLEAFITGRTPKPFMVSVSCDRQEEPRSLKFYAEGIEEALFADIREMFGRPSVYVAIGDGYPKPSDFNLAFGHRVTGLHF